MEKFRIHIIIGARPNFMKAAPVYHALKEVDEVDVEMIHTGQHYDKKLSDDILADLQVPAPEVNLKVGSGSHAVQTANIMIAYEALCMTDRPDLVIVVGDVNSTIACALTAAKLGLQVAHLESGLRSGDRGMPEEINRLLTDRISDVLWTPSEDADYNLLSEGVEKKKITFVGNLMIDSLVRMTPKIDVIDVFEEYGVKSGEFVLLTLHRPSNVDDPEKLASILNKISDTAKHFGKSVVFPVHPRTKKMLNHSGVSEVVKNPSFRLLEPLSYLHFMAMVKKASIVITDSGGIQEETTFLGVPCLTLRANTERPITISQGTNRLVKADQILSAAGELLNMQKKGNYNPPKYWDGGSAGRILADVKERYLKNR